MNVTLAIGATLFLGAFYSWTNRINGTFFFGRSVTPEIRDTTEARTITRQYITAIVASIALTIPLAWLGARFGRHLAAIGPLAECLAFWAIFARANRQVRALTASNSDTIARENIVQVPLLESPTYSIPGPVTSLLPAFLAALALLAALLVSGNGPHLGAAWTAWSEGIDVHQLAGLLGMSLGLLCASTALLVLFRNSARLRTRMAQYTVRASVSMQWIGLALLLAVFACNYLGVSPSRGATRSFTSIVLAAALATMVWNQARARRFVPPPVEMGADDRWRWGLFYVDPNDPALFVQSRCGAGYTLNYGRMLAWPISFALAAYFVVMLLLPMHH